MNSADQMLQIIEEAQRELDVRDPLVRCLQSMHPYITLLNHQDIHWQDTVDKLSAEVSEHEAGLDQEEFQALTRVLGALADWKADTNMTGCGFRPLQGRVLPDCITAHLDSFPDVTAWRERRLCDGELRVNFNQPRTTICIRCGVFLDRCFLCDGSCDMLPDVSDLCEIGSEATYFDHFFRLASMMKRMYGHLGFDCAQFLHDYGPLAAYSLETSRITIEASAAKFIRGFKMADLGPKAHMVRKLSLMGIKRKQDVVNHLRTAAQAFVQGRFSELSALDFWIAGSWVEAAAIPTCQKKLLREVCAVFSSKFEQLFTWGVIPPDYTRAYGVLRKSVLRTL